MSQALMAPAPEPVLDSTFEFVERELESAAGEDRCLFLTVPAPAVAPETLLRLGDPAMAFLWDPPVARAYAGLGVCRRIDLDGPDRFAALRREAQALFARLRMATHPAADETSPRLFGGFAFDVGSAARDPWTELGDGCFTLPRFTYSRLDGHAVLSLAADGRELADRRRREALFGELDAVLAGLEDERRDETSPPPVVRIDDPSHELWVGRIEAIREVIAAGRYEKIVAADRSRVEFAAPLEPASVLARLARGLRSSTRFAFCRPSSTFLGATPERLIARRGRRIESEALAGSIEIGVEQAAQLLASGKDQREHRLVVDSIVRRLRPLCHHLDVAGEPRVRELAEVLHLHTPIIGTLAEPRHVLELVEVLHPTPAVGGVPTAEAVQWIRSREPQGRGWYAAPVGWFDAAGDGEFAVALRSCVLRGREAFLWAGAGIVGDSDPELEYVETELKKRALLRALGA